jgi:broad specificity phosphatase PhoE
MADLYLVRHGQASFGGPVYDKLSPVGERQSVLLGEWLKACGLEPDAVATGAPERQQRTAELCMQVGAGPPRAEWRLLEGLGEYDHDEVLLRHRPEFADRAVLNAELAKARDPRRAFQAIYAEAVARWVGGEHDGDYAESWTAFRARAVASLRALTSLPARSVWAFTSGGPVTAVVQHLLAIPDSHAFEVNWALVNTGVTRIRFSAGQDKVSLSYLNAFPHLEQARDPGLVTYR